MSQSKPNPDEGVIPEERDLKQEGLHPDVEMGSMSTSQVGKPSYEGLLHEVHALRSIVEELKQSLAKKDKKILKLEKALKDVKGMFSKSKWTNLTQQHEQRKVSLAESLKLEEELIETVEGLKDCMARAGKQVREKDVEIRKLGKKVERLREREQQRKLDNLKEVHGEEDTEAKVMMALMPGGGERRAAVAILPEEVWELILGNMSNPKDLWNCCNTCQLFENLLRPWKTGWMLEQALPHLYRHLSGAKLLECRQVSKGWYDGVNSFLDNHPSLQPHRADSDPRRLDVVYPLKEKGIGNCSVFGFGPGEDENFNLSLFEGLFPKELARNPFLARYVILFLRKPDGFEDTPEVEEQRWAKMYGFLETYGKEIWNLILFFPMQARPVTFERITELMTSKLFQIVPNLRKVVIVDAGFPMGMIDLEELPPAPNFKTLQVLPIGERDGLVDALLNKYHLQLEVLHLDDTAWEYVDDLEWPNLKELLLYLDLDDGGFDLETLFELRMPQLSKLNLSLDDTRVTRVLNFPGLVAAINELTATTSLSSFGFVGPFEDVNSEQLDANAVVLEGVKTLELIDPWDGNSIRLLSHNFLRYFPFIENLVIMVRNHSRGKFEIGVDLMADEECKQTAAGLEPVDEFVEVNKYVYDGQMYKSNIWELLPRLKVFTFQWDVYTRENYEAYAKQRPSSTTWEREGVSMEYE